MVVEDIARIMNTIATSTTPFIDRAQDLATLFQLLAKPTCRLLTLVGPGGIGKTRLALEVARTVLDDARGSDNSCRLAGAFPDGVFFVGLQPLTSPDLIQSAIAKGIGFQFAPGANPRQELLDYLEPQVCLLVLDNFEHLMDGLEIVVEILAHAPGIKVLVTSRETLNLQEEWLFRLTGMSYPINDNGADLMEFGAIKLFMERAQRACPEFSLDQDSRAVMDICKLVEGLPLALEMTAVWLKRLPCSEIAMQLKQGLAILETPNRDTPSRHRSMRTVFEYSWNLLTEAERDVFKRCSVFRDGFNFVAAQTVTGASLNTLSALVDKSLLRVNAMGRYDMHELLRQYAEAQLELSPAECQQTFTAHCAYFIDYLAQRSSAIHHDSRQEEDELIQELENLRTAWQWAVTHQFVEQMEEAACCFRALYRHMHLYQEGDELFGKAALALQDTSEVLRAHCLFAQAWFARYCGQFDRASDLLEKCLAIAQPLNHASLLSSIYLYLSEIATANGDYKHAKQFGQAGYEAEARIGREWGFTYTLTNLAKIEVLSGDCDEAERLVTEAVRIAQKHSIPVGLMDARNLQGKLALARQAYHEAESLFAETLAVERHIPYYPGVIVSLTGLGEISRELGAYSAARSHFAEALQVAITIHMAPHVLDTLVGIANLLLDTGDRQAAAALLQVVLAHNATSYETCARANHLLAHAGVQVPVHHDPVNLDKLAQALVDTTLAAEPASVPAEEDSSCLLNGREKQILALIADGLSNREIAERLYLALSTVKWYVSEIYGKLSVANRTQALNRARALDLLP